MASEQYDLERWRLTETDFRQGLSIKKSRKAEPAKTRLFIRAPLPYDWITAAAKLPGKCLHIAMSLRYLAGFSNGEPIKLSHKYPAEFGVSPKTINSALKRMEQMGLIAVDRRKGRSPIVTILNPGNNAEPMGSGASPPEEA